MNWFKKAQLEAPVDDSTKVYWDSKYPKAGGVVSGLSVLSNVDNTSSIGASLNSYYIYPGIREIPISDFDGPRSVFYAADDFSKSRQLSEKIKMSKQISPLIIAVDKEAPYILEGAHRYVALYELGVKSFPALLVLDQSDET